MNGERVRTILSAVVLCCLDVTSVLAQPVPPRPVAPSTDQREVVRQPAPPQSVQRQGALPGQCSLPDRVAVTDIAINPPQPVLGQAFTVALTIRNLCDTPIANVPWQIGQPDTPIMATGVHQAAVPAGQSFAVTVRWPANPGLRGLYGWVDPQNVFREQPENRKNNLRTLAINLVEQPPARTPVAGGTGPRLVQTVLNYQRAKDAGARFAHNPDSDSRCSTLGQYDPKHPAFQSFSVGDQSVVFSVSCIGFGGRGTPEAFTGFRLKNGWLIKLVEPPREFNKVQSDWQFVTRPKEGTDNPEMRMHLWGEAYGPLAGTVNVFVKIIIEGPEGTDPYIAAVR